MGQKEPSYTSFWGKVDSLDEHEYSCLAVQGQSLDPEQYIYINGPFWLWVHFVAPIFVITVDGQVLNRRNYIYPWSLMFHFVAPIFVIPLIHGILKVAHVDIL